MRSGRGPAGEVATEAPAEATALSTWGGVPGTRPLERETLVTEAPRAVPPGLPDHSDPHRPVHLHRRPDLRGGPRLCGEGPALQAGAGRGGRGEGAAEGAELGLRAAPGGE